MTLAVINYKKINGGFVSLERAFLVSYLTGVMMAVIGMLFSLIWFYVIGISGDCIESIKRVGAIFLGKGSTLIIMTVASLFSLFVGCAMGTLVALIIALATKQDRIMNFNVP